MYPHLGYLDRVSETCIAANKKAMSQPRGWDNKKTKNMRRYLPRGKAYKRLVNMEWKAMSSRLEKSCKIIKDYINRCGIED